MLVQEGFLSILDLSNWRMFCEFSLILSLYLNHFTSRSDVAISEASVGRYLFQKPDDSLDEGIFLRGFDLTLALLVQLDTISFDNFVYCVEWDGIYHQCRV